jgi:peptide-methionine (S)-S-oxide reductase
MMFFFSGPKSELPTAADALPGRQTPMSVPALHHVNGNPMTGALPEGCEEVFVGMGCFWGAERCFWQIPGVFVTAVGYIAGITPNPTYEEVCSGKTGHNEGVRIVYDTAATSLDAVLRTFWEGHDPTQGMRQGNDAGTQYRSGIYCTSDEQLRTAEGSRKEYDKALSSAGRSKITTEILMAGPFYFAEDYHQQYLAKNPGGYCGLGGTGIKLETNN